MIQDDPSIVKPALTELKQNFLTNQTKDLKFRKKQIQNMLQGLKDLEPEFNQALEKDLGTSEFYSKIFSVASSRADIEHTLHGFENWAKPKKYDTSMLTGPAKSYVQFEPFGVALIIGAWNYPLFLTLCPAAQAIAAGNCVIIKPSEMAPESSKVVAKLFQKYMDPRFYRVLEGGYKVVNECTHSPFDLILFTGSSEKGKLVAKAAAENLIPCILELGGKSPTIVDKDVNMENAVLRITQGRFLNAGQTCIAADFVLCHESVLDEFTKRLLAKVTEFYGPDPQKSNAYTKIINEMHTERIKSMIDEEHGGKILTGGKSIVKERYIEPTVVLNPKPDSKMMQEEIFGPILPIIPYKNIYEAIKFVNERPKPLVLYYFGKQNKEYVNQKTSSGNYSVNECVFHCANSDLVFGGVQNSGMGGYHGQMGFENMSHKKGVFDKYPINSFPFNARYPPYTAGRQKILLNLFEYMNISQYKTFRNLSFILATGITYGIYRAGYMTPFINSMRPYIQETFNKLSKL